jgi:hypothetical protein
MIEIKMIQLVCLDNTGQVNWLVLMDTQQRIVMMIFLMILMMISKVIFLLEVAKITISKLRLLSFMNEETGLIIASD